MRKLTLLLVTSLLLSGCLAPKMFLEPKYRGLTYRDIKAAEHPASVRLIVYGQMNGTNNSHSASRYRRYVERALAASRVMIVDEKGNDGVLTVTINNVGSVSDAVGKGVVLGLTLGAVGSVVTDGYIMTVDYKPAGGAEFKGTYHHALYTAFGNTKAPQNMAPLTVEQALTMLMEDLILHFLKDLQSTDKARSASPVREGPAPASAPIAGSTEA